MHSLILQIWLSCDCSKLHLSQQVLILLIILHLKVIH